MLKAVRPDTACMIDDNRKLIRAIARGLTGSNDTEDLEQEGALGLIRASQVWDPNALRHCSRLPIRYAMLEYLRHNPRLSAGTPERPDPAIQPDEALAKDQVLDKLHTAVNELPVRQRRVVWHYLAGRSSRATARRMHITQRAAQRLHHSAVLALRVAIGG